MKITVTDLGIVREFDNVRDCTDFVLERCLNCSKELGKKSGGTFCRKCYTSLSPYGKRFLIEKFRGKVLGFKKGEL